MKYLTLFVFFILLNVNTLRAEITGYWKTIDDKTGKPQSVVAVYEYDGKYYGRLAETFNDNGEVEDTMATPKNRAKGVKGNPYYSGLDFIWGLEKEGTKYTNGKIMDPQAGKIYQAEMWLKDGNLIVRGKILIFGRNQTWLPATAEDFPPGFARPDITKFVPEIPEPNEELAENEND